ncbi:hypothetical protein B0T22DRAFT_502940 [Podospora appendiculata]|uniref:Uncharacterized protein n=1 Tax=Podospora appendiculata TaxID=314037 RepID=A0AAE0XFH6_9PEZI|nr:hypothetical protein B0T22DRAFT_502940 [Podospora appendiculata]
MQPIQLRIRPLHLSSSTSPPVLRLLMTTDGYENTVANKNPTSENGLQWHSLQMSLEEVEAAPSDPNFRATRYFHQHRTIHISIKSLQIPGTREAEKIGTIVVKYVSIKTCEHIHHSTGDKTREIPELFCATIKNNHNIHLLSSVLAMTLVFEKVSLLVKDAAVKYLDPKSQPVADALDQLRTERILANPGEKDDKNYLSR